MGRVLKRPKTSNKIKRAPARMPHSPMSILKQCLDVYEFTAADEILAAFSMVNGLPVARDSDLDIPTRQPQFDDADEHAARRSDLTRVYPAWRHDLAGTAALQVLDAVLFAETPLSALDRAQHWRKGTARIHLATALKHFAALRGNAPRGARWKYEPPAPAKKGTTI